MPISRARTSHGGQAPRALALRVGKDSGMAPQAVEIAQNGLDDPRARGRLGRRIDQRRGAAGAADASLGRFRPTLSRVSVGRGKQPNRISYRRPSRRVPIFSAALSAVPAGVGTIFQLDCPSWGAGVFAAKIKESKKLRESAGKLLKSLSRINLCACGLAYRWASPSSAATPSAGSGHARAAARTSAR
jgi:hypothetical protein